VSDPWEGLTGPAPDARTEAAKKAVEVDLAVFESQHKDALLVMLRKQYERGPMYKPFDADELWRRLTQLAQGYFWRRSMTPATDRLALLGELAQTLGKARGMADKAARDQFGSDLFSAWFDRTPGHDPRGRIVDDDGSLRVEHFVEADFKKMAESLADFQAAAIRAADDVPTPGPGRPAILPKGHIHALADVYRKSTEHEPGAGDGAFAHFVHDFYTAVGRDKIEYESVIDAIKDARREHGQL
jgi:hypothetical protein